MKIFNLAYSHALLFYSFYRKSIKTIILLGLDYLNKKTKNNQLKVWNSNRKLLAKLL